MGGSSGGGLPQDAHGLGEQMQTAMQMMGMMPQMSDIFGGQGFGSTYDPQGGLWSTPAVSSMPQQSNLDQLLQIPQAAPPARTPQGAFLDWMKKGTNAPPGSSRRSGYQAGGRL